jgi:hypothetical protein
MPAMFEPGPTAPLTATCVLDPDEPITARYLWRALTGPDPCPAGAARFAPRAR